MNRDAFPKGVTVHPWTWQVMKASKRFAEESLGTFDITVAPWLAKWNYLPRCRYQFGPTASSRDIFLRGNYEVFFRRELIVDLGGIAKGFAVDRAVEILKQNGIDCGIVNAGGDLRIFGPDIAACSSATSHGSETRCWGGAVARACHGNLGNLFFERRKYRDKYVSPLLDGRTGQPARELISVSVAAAECMAADALTKVVFALREKAAGLLAHYQADALLLECDGAPSWMFHSSCDTSRPDSIRLKRLQRYSLYAVLALLFLSGVAWAYWNYLVSSPGDFQIGAKSWALKVHGAAAMAILVLIGMLLTGHVRFAWRARRNRGNGSLFLTMFAVLTVTGYGLYYAGGESLRAWTSWIHLAVGLALPFLLILHIWLGKRTRTALPLQKRAPAVAKIDMA